MDASALVLSDAKQYPASKIPVQLIEESSCPMNLAGFDAMALD